MNQKPLIIMVDRNRRNLELLAQFLGKEGYQSRGAISLEEFAQVLTSFSAQIELVLLDITGFDHQIWELCQRLHHEQIPFLVTHLGKARRSPRQASPMALRVCW